jgi:hypothetical protein
MARSKTVEVTGSLKGRITRVRTARTVRHEDPQSPEMQTAAALAPGYALRVEQIGRSTGPSPEDIYRIARMQPTQIEAAGHFDMGFSTFQRLLTKPEMRDAWESGLAAGRVSLRELGFKHARGQGPAAVAAWIHLSKFHLGMSEKLLNGSGDSGGGPGEGSGALEQLARRIARLVEQGGSRVIDVTPVAEGGRSPELELGLLGAPEADSSERRLAHLDDPGGPRLREEPDGGGDSAPPRGDGASPQGVTDSQDGVGHPGCDDRGPERDHEDLAAVEPAEVRTDEAPVDVAQRGDSDNIFC